MNPKNYRSNTVKAHAHWLNNARILLYSRIFFALFLFIICFLWFFMFNNMADPSGQPFGYDFITYWAASYFALAGHAQDAYNASLLFKVQQIAVPAAWRKVYMWFYPPAFFLVVLPLAFLPYIAAFWTFMLSTLGAYLLVLRRIIRGSSAMWCIAAFSGLWINLFFGQNAFLTAAFAGAALLCVERRPVIAGVFIGLLAIKPHLAILFPLILIAIGAWRTFITATMTAVTFTVVATVILGNAVLRGFYANLGCARILMENGFIPWARMPSVFACMRLAGLTVGWAYAVHYVVAAVAVIVVWQVWRRCKGRNLRGATLMTATFLVSPYALDYDLAWLAFPIAWLTLDGQRKGWLHGEREVLVVAWLLPILMIPVAKALSLQVAPLVLCSLLWVTYRRATAESILGLPATHTPADHFMT
jgi:hypothetical protein